MSKHYFNTEVLLRNYLGKDLQSVLWPLNLMQHICLASRCLIKDNFVTPKNLKSNIISIFGTVFCSIFFMFKFIPPEFSGDHGFNLFMMQIFYFDISYYISGLFVNILMIVYHSADFVAMLFKIRDVQEVLNDTKQLKIHRIINWVLVFLLFYVYACNVVYLIRNGMSALYALCIPILWYFDANMIYAYGIVSILTKKAELWRQEVDKLYVTNMENKNSENVDRLRLLYSYFDILEAFNIFKKVFQVMILYHTVETFIHDLIYVKMTIEVCKHFIANKGFVFSQPSILLSLISWMLKNFFLQVSVSVQCDKYYNAQSDCQTSCVLFLKSEKCSGTATCKDKIAEERRVCKNILRSYTAEYTPLCACALYRVDSRLPLRLIGLIATYTIVLLQFAFMS